jgi:hypothetical protein
MRRKLEKQTSRSDDTERKERRRDSAAKCKAMDFAIRLTEEEMELPQPQATLPLS